MTGKQWIELFLESLFKFRHLANLESYNEKDSKWTEFMVEKVINEGMKDKSDCHVVSVVSRESTLRKDSGEYLNMDAMFIDNSAYKDWEDNEYDPPVLPSAVVEHENNRSIRKIRYCLWKLLCMRTKIRILICYQLNRDKIETLKNDLETTIKNRKLAEGLEGELFIIIGDTSKDSKLWENVDDIKSYFSIFKWNNIVDRLE